MLFNSLEFLLFYLPIVFFGFFAIARRDRGLAALWLAGASLFFYGWWNPRFVALLLLSIAFNFLAGRVIGSVDAHRSRALLIGAITVNLVLLGIFKYANFFVGAANGLGAELQPLDIVLPLGISFFTFTQIAFLVDVHRGIAKEYNFVHYLLFVTWFPHLIAGPVLHHKQMMPQFGDASTYLPDLRAISLGLTLFSFGLFKKVVLADTFAEFADPVFDAAAGGTPTMLLAAWTGVLAYALQIYFDFSGYSDMAIGLSRMFNVRLPLNFDSPYKAASIIDFWRRWHMTLSAFLRDYLYFALGGNRKGALRRYVNLFATMVLGGLWHGAGWNFVLWGALHGGYLVVNHGWRWLAGPARTAAHPLPRPVSVLLTFLAVIVAWVPFRATTPEATLSLWAGMAGLNGVSLPDSVAAALASIGVTIQSAGAFPGLRLYLKDVVPWTLVGLAIVWLLPNTQQLLAAHAPAWDRVESAGRLQLRRLDWRAGAAAGVLFAIAVLSFTRNSPFLYFQF